MNKQNKIELLLHPKHLQANWMKLITETYQDNEDFQAAVQDADAWLSQDHWQSLEDLKATFLKYNNLEQYMLSLLCCFIKTLQRGAMPIISLLAMHHAKGLTKKQSMTINGELMCSLLLVPSIIVEPDSQGSYIMSTTVEVTGDLATQSALSMYMPPMIVKPETLEQNTDSPFRSIKKDHNILGYFNRHDLEVSLDVINTQNAIPLKLNQAVLAYKKPFHREVLTEREEALLEPDDCYELEKRNWETYLEQQEAIVKILPERFYLTTKADKRGRLYCQGYHLNYQGNQYDKALIDLKTSCSFEWED